MTKPKALLIVAHADDEVLFAGGLLLSHPEFSWHVAAVTCQPGTDRDDRFARSMAAFQARGIDTFGWTLGIEDVPRWLSLAEKGQWAAAVENVGKTVKPVLVVTHNRFGEYGHPHHMTLGAVCHEVFPSLPVWHFLCKAPSGVGRQESLAFFHKVPLATGLAIPKRQVMDEAYPDELTGLRGNQPELVEWCFGDRELFTSESGWPT